MRLRLREAEPEMAVMGSGERRASRPRVKICGVTRAADALLALELGADYLGLNFYPPSPRFVDRATARRLVRTVRQAAPGVRLVGVFVDRPVSEVAETAADLGLDLLQFHGDETPDDVAPFAERAIKVFRVDERFDPGLLAAWSGVWGFLVDTRHPQLYGGSGESWDFGSLSRARDSDDSKSHRIFIAGGLGPGNVASALRAARPWGVDLCSGVESRPGHKDPALMRQLFEEIDHGESPVTP